MINYPLKACEFERNLNGSIVLGDIHCWPVERLGTASDLKSDMSITQSGNY